VTITIEQSTEFLFAKLHGRWSRAWSSDKLLLLLRTLNAQSLERILQPLAISPSDDASVQKQLAENLISELAGILRFLDADVAAYYRQICDRYTLENIKIGMHVRFARQTRHDAQALLVRSSYLPSLDLDAIVSAGTADELFKALPPLPFSEQLRPVLAELESSRDLFRAESQLDQVYYAYLSDGLEVLPETMRDAAGSLAGMEADILNLVMILRNQHLYQMPSKQLQTLFVRSGSTFSDARLEEMAQLPDARMLGDLLRGSAYGPSVAGSSQDQLYITENKLWNLLYLRAYRYLRDFTQPHLTLIAFPWLKRFEALNLARVFEGVRFNLSAGAIASMLIGVPHV